MPEIDWTRTMTQRFDFYTVDPLSWRDLELVDTITKCTIDWDYSKNTIGSAKISTTTNFGEQYIRAYLIANQDGIDYRRVMGTFLVLTPEDNFDGKISSWDLDAYSPLIELSEKYPPLGFCVPMGSNIMSTVSQLCADNMRAPVVKTEYCPDVLAMDFVADSKETWLDFLIALASQANYKIMLNEMGEVLFIPIQPTGSLRPTAIFTNNNSSILLPTIRQTRDLYSIPNKVEVVLSNSNGFYSSVVVNDNPNSPTSVQARGRYIELRETSPNISGSPTQAQIDQYAEQLLKEVSTLEYTVTYSHGFCDTGIGEGVMLNYPEAGLNNIKAKVINQSIELAPGCTVQETAVYTTELL